METQYFYSTEIEWTSQRQGKLSAPRLPELIIDAPPEFKGHEGVWTPEHLFVASVNSCFMTTFLAIAENSRLDFVSFRIEAEGKLENVTGAGFLITEIIIRPRLVLSEERSFDRALRIIEKAERHCLIANSIKTKITLEPEITVANTSEEPAHSFYPQTLPVTDGRSKEVSG